MKKCSYCGAEYPDDATACAIDQTPFDNSPLAAELPEASAFKRKNPSPSPIQIGHGWLGIVSICFLASSFSNLASFISLEYIGYQDEYFLERDLVVGVLCLFIFKGLRRHSDVWRICALALICFTIVEDCLRISYSFRHPAFISMSPTHYYITRGFNILIQLWFFRILTRPKIRDLFYGKKESAANPAFVSKDDDKQTNTASASVRIDEPDQASSQKEFRTDARLRIITTARMAGTLIFIGLIVYILLDIFFDRIISFPLGFICLYLALVGWCCYHQISWGNGIRLGETEIIFLRGQTEICRIPLSKVQNLKIGKKFISFHYQLDGAPENRRRVKFVGQGGFSIADWQEFTDSFVSYANAIKDA
jgi:hypothetical protein